MLEQWSRRRAERRVKDGDGRPLKRFRWWQLLGRSLFYLALPAADGQLVYAVDVRHGGAKEDGRVEAHLYRDGRHHAVAKVPAVFTVPGGQVEVTTSDHGIKRCHYVTADGAEHQLTPDPGSGAGRRAQLDRRHPTLSRWIGVGSVLMLVLGVGLNLLQILEPVSEIPPVRDLVGAFRSPVQLPLWLNITLALGAALASTERALRLRYRWFLDAAGG